MKKFILITTISFSVYFLGFLDKSYSNDLPKSMQAEQQKTEKKPDNITQNNDSIIGTAAPEFSALDINNVPVSLSDLKGKIIVLEWFDDACAYSSKHYASKNMQGLQDATKIKDTVWLTIMPKKITPENANLIFEKYSINSAYFIVDDELKITNLYNIKKVPSAVVIDRNGNFAFVGAIDNKPTTNEADVKGALNYVKSVVNSLYHGATQGRQIKEPYGCDIKK